MLKLQSKVITEPKDTTADSIMQAVAGYTEHLRYLRILTVFYTLHIFKCAVCLPVISMCLYTVFEHWYIFVYISEVELDVPAVALSVCSEGGCKLTIMCLI